MIPKRQFGRTGHISSRIIFGPYALSDATQEEADWALAMLIEFGLKHIDTAPMYGKAEKRIEVLGSSEMGLDVYRRLGFREYFKFGLYIYSS